jgi:hypothetical protein
MTEDLKPSYYMLKQEANNRKADFTNIYAHIHISDPCSNQGQDRT